MSRTNRGDGYFEYDRGKFDAGLAYWQNEVARTDGDLVIGYDKRHRKAIEEWADEYGLEIEWR